MMCNAMERCMAVEHNNAKTRKSENRNGSRCAMEWIGNLMVVKAMEIGWTTCNGMVVEWIGKR